RRETRETSSDQSGKSEYEDVFSLFSLLCCRMSSTSALFQLSMWIRHVHDYLTENLGIPVWGSYAIFVLATFFSGLALGLVSEAFGRD
ncbi:TMX1 protein, partial [Neodrepanis coruscans]|nr:TMX1 protein [Neodrepanis coruscans]